MKWILFAQLDYWKNVRVNNVYTFLPFIIIIGNLEDSKVNFENIVHPKGANVYNLCSTGIFFLKRTDKYWEAHYDFAHLEGIHLFVAINLRFRNT